MPNQTLQTGFRAVCDVIAEKQFNDLRRNKAYYDALILNTPSGKEKQEFKIGEIAVTGETSSLIKGIEVKIKEAYEENGYWKYICEYGGKKKFTCMQRQKDLIRV